MPDTYTIVASVADVQLVTPTETETVQRISAQAHPSEVVFSINIGASIYTPENVQSLFETYAASFNWVAAQPHVRAVWTGQGVTPANQLEETMTILVASSSGVSTTEIHGSYLLVDQRRAQAAIDAAVATMDAIEAG
jgi:hypothetical protein